MEFVQASLILLVFFLFELWLDLVLADFEFALVSFVADLFFVNYLAKNYVHRS
jgi:uncharacterized membrane protein